MPLSLSRLLAGDDALHKVLFGGANAKTADAEALARAKSLMSKGAKPADVWRQTGWYRGKDGDWRFEIDDSRAVMAPLELGPAYAAMDSFGRLQSPKSTETTLGAILRLPDLFAAYPGLADLKVQLRFIDDEEAHGMYEPAENGEPAKLTLFTLNAPPGDHDLRKTSLHEVQHALSDVAGFDYGPEDDRTYERRNDEVQARNVERRAGMSAAQRRASYPPSTADVPWGALQLSPERLARLKRDNR